MSQITKNALAASLKKLLETKPLDKITVVDMVSTTVMNLVAETGFEPATSGL